MAIISVEDVAVESEGSRLEATVSEASAQVAPEVGEEVGEPPAGPPSEPTIPEPSQVSLVGKINCSSSARAADFTGPKALAVPKAGSATMKIRYPKCEKRTTSENLQIQPLLQRS